MRAPMPYLAIAVATLLAACHDRSSPTERSDPAFSVNANNDTTGRPSHYAANGATAYLSWYAYGGDSLGYGYFSGYLSASRVGPVTDEWTEVSWSVTTCDEYWYCRGTGGYGTVPANVLTGGGGGPLRLAFDPEAYPGYLWVWGDSLGPVDITWRGNNQVTQRSSGTSEYSYPGYTFRSTGVTESSSAFATGTIGVVAVPSWAYATVGTNHNVTITFSH